MAPAALTLGDDQSRFSPTDQVEPLRAG